MAFNVAKLIGEQMIVFLPGYDAVALMAALSRGDQVTFGDLALAGLSVGGGALVAKLAGKAIRGISKFRKSRRILDRVDNATGLCGNCFVAGGLPPFYVPGAMRVGV
jgi:hypothetical protein